MKLKLRAFLPAFGLAVLISASCPTGVAEAQSSKPVTITADKVQSNAKTGEATAEGDVRITYGDKAVTGDKAVYNQNTGDGVVEGNARFTDPKSVISADRAEFNSITTLGELYRASASFEKLYFIRASRLSRLGENHYRATDCFLTTCDQAEPDWEFSSTDADVTIEGYAFMKHAVFRAGGWPILYLPYMVAPAKVKRATGLLFPSPAYSSEFGFQIQNQFFWAIADNQDATISHHYLGQAGNKAGLEYRYIFSPTTFGTLNTEYLKETDPNKTSNRDLWRVQYDHRQTLPWSVDAVAHINKESEGNVSREYGSDIADRARVYTDSYVTFTKNWATRSLVLMARDQTALDSTNAQAVRKTPELKFTNQKEKLWSSPFYVALDSSYTSFRTESGADADKTIYDVDRADFSPTLSLPIPISPYLSAEASAGYRATWYSKGVDSTTGQTVAEGFTRNVYNLSASVTGPKTFRLFDTASAETPKLKHLITPRLLWAYTPGMEMDGENRTKVKAIDSVDYADPQNTLTFQLYNDLLAKKILGPESSQTVSLARLILSQSYDINEADRTDIPDADKRPFLSTEIKLMANPASWLVVDYRTTYNLYERLWDTSSLGFGARSNSVNLALDRSYQWGGVGGTDTAWDTVYVEVKLPWWRMTADYSVIYDEIQGSATNSMARVRYRRDCWGFGVSHEQRRISRTDTDGASDLVDEIRTMFTVTLVGVGDVLGADQPALAKPKL